MPTVDEAFQDRETYGNAPGWAQRRQAETPAGQPAPVPPAQEDAPPASDVETAPSAAPVESQEPVVSPESAPPQPAVEPAPESDVPFHQHPRWIERQQELARERQRATDLQRQNQLLLETMQKVVPQPQPTQTPDFWEGRINHADPATAQYWQGQKQMFELAVQTGKQAAIAELSPVIQAGMQKLAAIDTRDFRKENPDIAPGSQDEALVIAYMEGRVDGLRHPIESARNNAVIKRLEAENRALKSKQSAIPAKRAAAQTTHGAGIPQGAGLPARPGDWREQAGEVLDRGGGMKDVLHLVFGGGRR